MRTALRHVIGLTIWAGAYLSGVQIAHHHFLTGGILIFVSAFAVGAITARAFLTGGSSSGPGHRSVISGNAGSNPAPPPSHPEGAKYGNDGGT